MDGKIEVTAYTSTDLPAMGVTGLSATNTPLVTTDGTKEVDTYTVIPGVTGVTGDGGSATFVYNGKTYTQAYITSATATVTALAAQINAADLSVTAAGTGATTFTLTSNNGTHTPVSYTHLTLPTNREV